MCGRFALYTRPETLALYFGAQPPPEYRPRYNIAPGQPVLLLRQTTNRREFIFARWGLVPHWAKEIQTGYSTINARAETVATKPAYRSAFRRRRCLIPADGFYEWQARPESRRKKPWFIALRDRRPLSLAGLWERWQNPEGENLESCTILVTDANERFRPIHERMPVILPPPVWDFWLDPSNTDLEGLQSLLRPCPPEDLAAWPVSTTVNNPKNDSPECIEPLEAPGQSHESDVHSRS